VAAGDAPKRDATAAAGGVPPIHVRLEAAVADEIGRRRRRRIQRVEREAHLPAAHLRLVGGRTVPHPDRVAGAGVVAKALERIVCKRRSQPYRAGRRGCIKVKNREYWRYPEELEALRRVRDRRGWIASAGASSATRRRRT